MFDMKDIKNKVKVIAFDADDTLWDNQSYYDDAPSFVPLFGSSRIERSVAITSGSSSYPQAHCGAD